jgi:NAD(P)-dependent dehydrogenase (short-subunit alcohol dehydrogenase family)
LLRISPSTCSATVAANLLRGTGVRLSGLDISVTIGEVTRCAVIRPADETLNSDVIYITGGAGSIGLASARLAVDAGARVALIDRDEQALEQAAAALKGDVIAAPCDVSEEEPLRSAFDGADAAVGPPTGVVVASGIDRGGLVHELAAATWDAVLAVNLRGTFLTCREALRRMIGQRRGAIVCVSSPLAFVGVPGGASAYSASKGGVSAPVRTLAVDYAQYGIRVNALLPGPTESDLMWANVPSDEVSDVRDAVRREVPLGRLAAPEEPARVGLWLLSDAASYVTGAQVPCDGGVLAKASISI